MAEMFEVSICDERYTVEAFPAEGNHRKFTVGSIPLSCTVSRAGKPSCADVNYSVQAPRRVDIPSQELYTSAEFESVLSDDKVPSHARFVIGQWLHQSQVE